MCARRALSGGASLAPARGKPRPGLTWKQMGSVLASPLAEETSEYGVDGVQATPGPQHRL